MDGFAFATERRRLRLSQYDLGLMVGIRPTYIGEYERGRRTLSKFEMGALRRAMAEYRRRWSAVTELLEDH